VREALKTTKSKRLQTLINQGVAVFFCETQQISYYYLWGGCRIEEKEKRVIILRRRSKRIRVLV
jgi:hypothetical protein